MCSFVPGHICHSIVLRLLCIPLIVHCTLQQPSAGIGCFCFCEGVLACLRRLCMHYSTCVLSENHSCSKNLLFFRMCRSVLVVDTVLSLSTASKKVRFALRTSQVLFLAL